MTTSNLLPNINVESQRLTLLIFQIKIKISTIIAPTSHLIVVVRLWLTLEKSKVLLQKMLENLRVVKMTLKISPKLLNLYSKLSLVSKICQPFLLNFKNQIKKMVKKIKLNLLQNINEVNQALVVLENVLQLRSNTRKMHPFHFLFL